MSGLFVKISSCSPISLRKVGHVHGNPVISFPTRMLQSDPRSKTLPKFPSRPPVKPHTPTELPRTPNYPDFGPFPPDEIADPPPLSPGPNPGPPTPSPPVHDAPRPPMPSPPGPDIPQRLPPDGFPPRGPDVIPLGPPEIEPLLPNQPDIPTSLNGLGWVGFLVRGGSGGRSCMDWCSTLVYSLCHEN